MAKRIYTLEYKDFIKRPQTKEFHTNDIISAMEQAKKFCFANGVTLGWVVSPSGKKYII